LTHIRSTLGPLVSTASPPVGHEWALHAQAGLAARERARLAREMHDVVSHQVSLIAVRAGAPQVVTKDADAAPASI
jgi:signal transduction histidine kinase